MWIAIGIIIGLYVIHKAFSGSLWAIVLSVLVVALSSYYYWHYVSFVLVVLAISTAIVFVGNKLMERRGQPQKDEVKALFAEQESTMMPKKATKQEISKMQSSNKKDTMASGVSLGVGLNDELFEDCLKEMRYIENELLPLINEMANSISSSYDNIAQVVSDLAEIAVDYADGHLSEKGKRQVYMLGTLVSFGISAYGEWKKQKEKAKQHAKLLVQKQAFAQSHIEQIRKVSPRLKKYRRQMKSLFDNRVVSVSYEMTKLKDSNYANQARDNIGKMLALYRQNLYYDFLVDYIGAEYNAWLAGKQESALEPVTLYDVNLEIVNSLFKSEDGLKAEFTRLLAMGENADGRISGGDILMLSDPQIVAFGIINNGGKEFENKLSGHNTVILNYLNQNKTYVDYRKRYKSYNNMMAKMPQIQWKWLLALIPVSVLVFVLYGSLITETWQLYTCIIAIAIVFLSLFSTDRGVRLQTYNECNDKLQIINKQILRNAIGYSYKRKDGYSAPTNIW